MANYVYATNPRKPIPIGVQGENDARTVVFDIHKWIEDYGNGTALLVHQRPGDAEPYPVTTAQKAGTVEWTVQQADIIAGAPGRAQLSYQVGDNIVARSPIYLTIAADEITNTTLADYDPAESWLNAILGAVQEAGDITDDVQAAKNAAAQAAASAEKAEEYSGKPPVITNDIWYTWDADAGEYKSTGEPSRGPAGPQGEKGDTGEAAGFGVPVITVDDTTGTPSATVEASGPDTAKVFTFAFSGLKGEIGPRGEQGPQGETGTQGPQGTAAGFGEATASVDESTGVPDVTVSTSGPDTAKVFDFQFSGLKGETGSAAGFGQITATVGDTVGTPSVSVEASGPDTAKNLAFTFANLKGVPGQSVGSIQRTSGTGAPGTTDTYTMYDDGGGTIGTFTVYNGTDGTGSGDFKADGSVPMTGDLNAGEHKIINVAAPTADGDAANKAYVDSAVDNVEIVKTATGEVISVSDSADYRLLGLKLYGKSVQDGVPTPEAPVEIKSAGDGGDVTTYVFGQNLIDPMDTGKWRILNNATFEILENGKIKVTGSRGYSGVKYNIPSDAINLLKGKKCVISRTIDSQTNESAVVIVQLTVNTASGLKYYYNIGSPITIDAYATSVKFDVIVNNTSTTLEAPNTVVFSNLGIYFGEATQSWDTYEPMQTLTYPTPNGLPGIPVKSGGNYTDEDGQQWICDEVDFASGKKIQRVGVINSYNSESVGDVYMSSTGQLTAGAKVLYPLTEPVETDLTPEQLAAYAALTTYKPNTTVTTDSSPAAGLEVKYLTDSGVAEVLDYYASKDDLAHKQDKLSGTAGQFVGFDAEGEAGAQEITATDVGAVAADGTTAMTGNFNAGGHRVTNVGAPTAAGDAVRQSDLQAVSDEIDAIIAGTTPVNIPVATDVKAGIVKPGEHLNVEADGTLNAEWPDLSGYATQSWVNERGFLTAVPAEYVTEDELSAKGYLTAVPAEYVTDTELTAKGYATSADVAETYAKKALKFTGTFTAAGWAQETAVGPPGGTSVRYSQTINVSGLTADDEPIIDLNSTATDADTFDGQLEAFGLVSNFTTGAGTLTAVVLGDSAPTVDIPIHGVVVY